MMRLAKTLLFVVAAVSLLLSNAVAAENCDDGQSHIRLNQLGFHVDGGKRAVIAAAATDPLHWELVDRSGVVVLDGETRVFGDDPVSGDHVHLADFSSARTGGDGFRIRTACAESDTFWLNRRSFGTLAYDAFAYFYHNRSGIPISELHSGGEAWSRPAGHERDTATCRTGEDTNGNYWPGCDYTLDLTGGWYDAGDHGKYVVNGGIATWTLLNFFERQRMLGIACGREIFAVFRDV